MALLWPKKEKILGQLDSAPEKKVDLNEGNVCGHCGEALTKLIAGLDKLSDLIVLIV